jgi:hypothetical protein
MFLKHQSNHRTLGFNLPGHRDRHGFGDMLVVSIFDLGKGISMSIATEVIVVYKRKSLFHLKEASV